MALPNAYNQSAAFANFPFNPGDNFTSLDDWTYNVEKPSVVTDGATSDNANGWFQTLTNSGTIALGSTQAGYEGMPISTTGASSGNQNAFIATLGLKYTPARTAIFIAKLYVADPNANAYSFFFGWGNKQADPNGTLFTDGAWIKGTTASGAIAFTGNSRSASGATATTATLGTIASGVPRTVELAVIMSNGVMSFATHDPTLTTNPWSILSTTTIPAATVLLRPHFVHYTNTANTNAIQIGNLSYWISRPATY